MLARKGNRKYVVKEKMTLCIEVVNVCIYGNKTIITGREKKKKTFAFCEFSKTHHGKKRWEKRVREKNMQSDPHILIAHTEMVIWFFELILTHELHFYLPSK